MQMQEVKSYDEAKSNDGETKPIQQILMKKYNL